MANPIFIKNYNAGGAIGPNLIVKPGANDGEVLQGTASTEALTGVTQQQITVASGEPVDVIHAGIGEVLLGGTVTRGDFITSDANGKGVAAAPAAGVNANVIGRALVSGVVGDIAPVLIAPGRIQG